MFGYQENGYHSEVTKSVSTILREAEEDGTLEENTEWQHVDLEEVLQKLSELDEFEQMHLLESEYICLYYLVCEVKGIDTTEFMEFCRGLKDKDV